MTKTLALVLYASAAVIALGAAAVLAVMIPSSDAGNYLGLVAPCAVLAAASLGFASSFVRSRAPGIVAIVLGLILAVPACLSGVWCSALRGGNDDKWVCVIAGGAAALASVFVCAAGVARTSIRAR